MNVIVVKNYEEVCQKGVELFIEQIQEKNNINLGLATGSTPLGLYDKLIAWAQEQNADLSHVTTFNWMNILVFQKKIQIATIII